MKEIFLLKLGEIVLKGANKRQFEDKLRQNVRRRMRPYGNFDVYIMQSTVYVEPMDELADLDSAWEACRSILDLLVCVAAVLAKRIWTVSSTQLKNIWAMILIARHPLKWNPSDPTSRSL